MDYQKTLLLLLLALVLGACGTTTPRSAVQTPMGTVMDGNTLAWRTCYFRVAWPEDTEPQWSVDLLLAHKVMGPVLDRHATDLFRWRFHRRANRDSAGHQFSFVFYTGSSKAEVIISEIQQSEWRTRLIEEKVLDSAGCEEAENQSRPDITDSSDSNWSDSMQKHWPVYIMGVSSLWLGLIDEAISSRNLGGSDIKQVLRDYDEANQIVTASWQNEAQHALLHHLNAIFGYEELFIRF
jgi:hypothetical protein